MFKSHGALGGYYKRLLASHGRSIALFPVLFAMLGRIVSLLGAVGQRGIHLEYKFPERPTCKQGHLHGPLLISNLGDEDCRPTTIDVLAEPCYLAAELSVAEIKAGQATSVSLVLRLSPRQANTHIPAGIRLVRDGIETSVPMPTGTFDNKNTPDCHVPDDCHANE